MKHRQLERNLHRPTKRPLNISKQSYQSRPRAFNQNQQRRKKSDYSLSCLKEYNLSKQDLWELRQALQKISHYFHSRKSSDHQQRLTSPYLQQQRSLFIDDPSLSPLYTDEYFIRNGLLNHNDGPEIFSSRNRCSKPTPSYSSMNISSPLVLLPNQKHLFTALTSNFASNQPKCSRSSMAYAGDHQRETESMNIRRHKVQTWERENGFQRKISIGGNRSEYHRSSLIRNPLMITATQVLKEKKPELQSSNCDQLFPMVKKLGKTFLDQKTSLFLIAHSTIHHYSIFEREDIFPTII